MPLRENSIWLRDADSRRKLSKALRAETDAGAEQEQISPPATYLVGGEDVHG
jgi:hypothetical protein